MSIWNLNVNCGITFGEDSRLTVGEKLKSYGATTALLLYDMAMDQFGYQREIEKVINDANIKVVCYQVEEGEPTAQKSDRAYDFAKDKSVDAIVAIGGGSTMDTGKMVGKLLANGGKTRDYQNNPCIGNTVFRPLIALPSTAGTGAELTPYLTCATEDGKKGGVANTPVTCAIVDPVLTYKLPPVVTANTGIDALCHASEVLCNCTSIPNSFADLVCMEVIRTIFKWLPIAYQDGSNKEARKWMSYAATMGGFALCLRMISFGHPIANQISNTFHTPHGAGCSIGMTAFVHYNVTENPEWIRLNAECLGIQQDGLSYDEVAVQVVKAYDDLRKLCGMKNIKELGAEESYVDEIIENLKADKNLAYNPCPPKMDVLQKVLHEIYAL